MEYTMKDYDKVVIVDFDGTLCLFENSCEAKNIPNGIPNVKLINKLNELYDKGIQIEIYTARGHISCNSREEAKEKYENLIKEWLKKHNVKYSKLSFEKPYARVYIDDRAIRPSETYILDKIFGI